jgi:ketosteroid isomerase-like protein
VAPASPSGAAILKLVATANIDLVRSLYPAWERGDFSSVDWAHPQIEYVVPDGPSPGTWTGLGGLENWREVLDAWEDFRFHAEEFRELDGERVLVLTRFSGRGRTSGLEIGQMQANGANLFHVSSGKVIRSVFYFDRERALADLGLASEGDAADPLRRHAG